ncbi:MAG: hypothetical protein MUF00_20965 [Gemmatimonadaceae bacterium]|jgi:hypothetical protein|nr:hypothetical protein [Gemmatimonadaceae bacterium]
MTSDGGPNRSTIVGENYVIEAGTSITLQCGASSIHMNQAGFITIKGMVISILGGMNCNMTAPMTNVTGSILLTNTATVAITAGAVIRSHAATLNHMGSGGKATIVASDDAIVQGATVKLN